MKLSLMRCSCFTRPLAAWADSLSVGESAGAKLIGTVGSAQKAQRAKEAGARQVINYREESIVERLKALTDGKKVAVVYDSVGKDTGRPLWTACSAAA